MSFNSRITGVGSCIPPKAITNFDLEEMLDTSDEWIQQRTGIVKRHWVDENTSTSDLGLDASKKAIESAGIDKSEIDMIIFATLSPDHDFPGNACFLQEKLGLSTIAALDIRQQCSGFIYGLSIADKFIASGSHKNILLVGAEVQSKGLDKTPKGRNVSILFGDGAGAVIVSRTEIKDASKDAHVLSTALHAEGKFAKELWIPGPGTALGKDRLNQQMLDEGLNFGHMNGKTVFVHAIKRMCETITNSCKEQGIDIQDVDLFFFHQANMRINSKVAEVLGISEDKVFNTIQDYGNTTAATIPIGIDKAVEAGVLKPGMLVASAAFGAGFTWGSAIFRY